MLFEIKPKSRRKDLYDREKELKEFRDALKLGENLILILGIRRLGKSSLLNVALNESKLPYAKIDVRSLYFTFGTIPQDVLVREILESLLRSTRRFRKFRVGLERLVDSIEGIEVSGLKVRIGRKVHLIDILEKIDSWGERVIIAFDEAQYLRFSGLQYDGLIAYAIDNLPNVTFVLTGSEVGMLHDFLGLDNPKKPLFGRYAREIVLERFSRDKSIDFLIKGFSELSIDVPQDEIEDAVEKLDGIVGWLTMYGYLRGVRKLSHEEALSELLNMARSLVREELDKILSYSKRYGMILKAVSLGNERWSEIKEFVESKTGRINDAKFSILLRNLVKYGYLDKISGKYRIPDPIVREIIRRYC
ncbi:ATPase [Pyrococcus kukulkanii]|uniref:ATPase n=1 Tax=Pyrococcus kukulkanii TaxID=1609559 RepID=A0A127BAK4_9EURY|nr:ATP-binding protein [Pyrococcus kukulkanii]AMM53686.1 ATPase [Pyrococcus kukulkanii]